MKRKLVFVTLVLICFSLTGCISFMVNPAYVSLPSITIVNNTGYRVDSIHFSPTTDRSWGPDRSSSNQSLRNGQSITLNLPYPISQYNRYDFLLIDLDGDGYTKMNVSLRGGDRIVFTFSDFVGKRF